MNLRKHHSHTLRTAAATLLVYGEGEGEREGEGDGERERASKGERGERECREREREGTRMFEFSTRDLNGTWGMVDSCMPSW